MSPVLDVSVGFWKRLGGPLGHWGERTGQPPAAPEHEFSGRQNSLDARLRGRVPDEWQHFCCHSLTSLHRTGLRSRRMCTCGRTSTGRWGVVRPGFWYRYCDFLMSGRQYVKAVGRGAALNSFEREAGPMSSTQPRAGCISEWTHTHAQARIQFSQQRDRTQSRRCAARPPCVCSRMRFVPGVACVPRRPRPCCVPVRAATCCS